MRYEETRYATTWHAAVIEAVIQTREDITPLTSST